MDYRGPQGAVPGGGQQGFRSFGLIDPTTPLPKCAGGGTVGLLLGIQDIRLDPVLVGTLLLGIGVYQCPFVDIWGSSRAFASPYPSFQFTGTEIESTSMMIHLLNSPSLPVKHGRRHRRSRRNPCLCHFSLAGCGGLPHRFLQHRQHQQQPGIHRANV